MGVSVAIEFTPRAYAHEVNGDPTTDEGAKEITQWLTGLGFPVNQVGVLRRLSHTSILVSTSGPLPIEKGDWVVIYAGELHVMSPQKFHLFREGRVR